MYTTMIAIIAVVVLVPLILAILFKVLWKVPAADEALIVTGFGVKGRAVGDRIFKIVTGGGAFVVPVMQKAQYLGMPADKALLEVEGVDSQKIPVGVRGVAIFKVGDDEASITNAGVRFLEAQQGQMHDLVREVFHGHLRSIIGSMSVEDLIANRNELAQSTRDASADEMQKLGLVIDSLQIQEIIDPTGYIRALGEPRAAEVKMRARIAAAAADREATEREQEAEALKAAARRDSEIKRAAYQAEIDSQSAQSAQAGPLADAEARKQVVVQETAVAELEAEREEKRLDTTIRKPADAAAYEKQVQAEAERVARISIAEAQAREVELAAAAKAKQIEQIGTSEARITTARGIADGEATKAKGEAEGASIRARGLAEAESIAKRAEALEKEADAVIGQQLAEQLPEIVRAAAESFKHVDNLTVLNGAQGISEIIAQVIGQAGPALDMAQGALSRTQKTVQRRQTGGELPGSGSGRPSGLRSACSVYRPPSSPRPLFLLFPLPLPAPPEVAGRPPSRRRPNATTPSPSLPLSAPGTAPTDATSSRRAQRAIAGLRARSGAVAVRRLQRDREARVASRVGGGDQPDGPAAVRVRVERPADTRPPRGRDEPELIEAVRPRVAQALDVEHYLAADRGHAHGGGDVHALADGAAQGAR